MTSSRVVAAALLVSVLDQLGRPFSGVWPTDHLDLSWMAGLELAREQRLQHGADIVFPYGPWGVLDVPTRIETDILWLAGMFRAAAVVALFAALVVTLPPGRWRVCLAAALAVLLGNNGTVGWMLMLAVVVAGVGSLAKSRSPNMAVLVLGAGISALLLQVKFSEGVLSFAVVGLVTLCTRTPLLWLAAGLSFATVFVVAWLAAHQSLANIASWITLSVELVRGYSEAMAYLEFNSLTVVMMVAAGITSMVVILARGMPRPAKFCALAVVLFMCKVSLALAEGGHLLQGYMGLFALLVVVASTTTWRATRFVAVAMATVLAVPMSMPLTIMTRDLSTQVFSLEAWPARQARQEPLAKRDLIDELAIDPELLTLLEGRKVTIDPLKVSAAWAHDLDWRPTLLLQRYVSYTPRLDHLNAEALLSDPQIRMLRERDVEVLGFSDWVGPEYNLALVCNFEEIESIGAWSVLARGLDRCGQERSVSEQRVEAGQVVALPRPDDVLIAVRFQPDPRSVADRVLAFVGPQRGLLHARIGDEVARVPEILAGGPLIVGAPIGEPTLSGDPSPETVSFDRGGELEIIEIPLLGRESE